MDEAKTALFLALGQIASKGISNNTSIVPTERLLISPTHDLALMLPTSLRQANDAAEAYKLFFVFENYLRSLIVQELSQDVTTSWWDKLPSDLQIEVTKLEEQEEVKGWMALGSRDKSALMTLPQLVKVIDHNWKQVFEDVVRDRALLQEARTIGHLRNTICHMSVISAEELERIRQTMRDWFRAVAP